MKVNKIIAVLLGMSFFTSGMAVYGEEADIIGKQTDDRFHLFKALGIITDYESEADFFDIPYVSRGEFCTMMSFLINDELPMTDNNYPFSDISENKDKNAISYLHGLDIVSGVGENEFKPEIAITKEQAIIVASRILGYDFFIENNPGTDYIDVAQKYKLLQNISGDLSEAITKEQLLTLLENISEAEPFGVNIDNNMPQYGFHEEKSILEVYRDICKAEGVMTENVYTDELGIKNSQRGTIVVDGIEYTDDNCQDKSDFLGKYVEVYYKDDKSDRTALYVVTDDRKTTELVLTPDMITEPVTMDEVTYEEDNKTKRAKLSRALKVVYNGVAYKDYEISDLSPEYGELRLIDNNEDEIYDYALITEYKLMWFDRYSPLDKKYYNKLSTGVSEINVNDPQIERNFYIEADGEKTDRFGVSSGNILLVAESLNDGEKLTRIYASSEVVKGKLSRDRINEYGERELVVDGQEYLVNPDTVTAYENQDNALAKLIIGEEYLFYIDAKGRIAAFEKSTNNAELYGYATRYYLHEDEERYSVKLFNENGEWEKLYLAQKLRVNGEKLKDEIAFELLAPGGISSPDMIKYRLSNGEISHIQTPEKSSEYKKDAFTTSGLNEFMYVGQTQNLGDRYFFNSGAKIFVIPTNSGASDNDYRIQNSGILKTETERYNMEVYDADEFGHSSIFKLETSTGSVGRADVTYHIVRETGHIVDEYNEVIGYMNCSADGEDELVYYGREEDSFAGLVPGDVIQIEKDQNGRVIEYTEVYKSSQFGTLYDDGQPDMYNTSIDIRGYVLNLDPTRYVLKLNIKQDPVYIKSTSAPNVVMFEKNKVRLGTFNDIKIGDYIVARVGYGQLSDIVIIRN